MGRETANASPLPILQAAVATVGAAVATVGPATAPGFRFHPTDEELVSYYLKRKLSDKPMRFNAIGEVDIYKNEPWDLAGYSRLKTRDQEWYFFSALDKKYGNGARMNRATGKGYWKATGKDREVRNDSHLIGMKKTLVFHIGHAPGGQRTNWVMYEYRLVEDELEKYGTCQVEKDAYVLCKIFHKNNIGPPNGNLYAPFIEEEWDDGEAAVVPGVDTVDKVAPVDDPYIERNNIEQDTQSICMDPLSVDNGPPREIQNHFPINNGPPREIQNLFPVNIEPPRETQNLFPINNGSPRETQNLFPINNESPRETQHLLLVNNEPPRETQNLLPMCKSDRVDDVTPVCVLNTQAPFPLLQFKRRRHNDSSSNRSNASENSTRATEDFCSSTTKTAATMATTASTSMASATTTAISALLEFSLMESLEPKESPYVGQRTFNSVNLHSSVPPSISKLINDLQKEVHEVSVDRETLNLELMSNHAIINILQSRIDFLSYENENLKRSIRDRAT